MTWIGIYLILPVLRPQQHLQNPEDWVVDFDAVESCYILTFYKFWFVTFVSQNTIWGNGFRFFRPLYLTHYNEFFVTFLCNVLQQITWRPWHYCKTQHSGEMGKKHYLTILYLYEDSPGISFKQEIKKSLLFSHSFFEKSYQRCSNLFPNIHMFSFLIF